MISAMRWSVHNALLCALAPAAFRQDWWHWNASVEYVHCDVCGRVIGRAGWRNHGDDRRLDQILAAHEAEHVGRLGQDRVTAAEALHLIRSDRSTGVIGNDHLWDDIFLEVWGVRRRETLREMAAP